MSSILQIISGAGHHVYADKTEIFNKHVLEACSLSDSIDKLTSKHAPQIIKGVLPTKKWLPMDSNDSKSEDEDEDNIKNNKKEDNNTETGDNDKKTYPVLTKKS